MSLKTFHLFFISISVLMFFAIAAGQGSAYSESGAIGDLVRAIAAAAGGVGLIVYEVAFVRKTKQISYF